MLSFRSSGYSLKTPVPGSHPSVLNHPLSRHNQMSVSLSLSQKWCAAHGVCRGSGLVFDGYLCGSRAVHLGLALCALG